MRSRSTADLTAEGRITRAQRVVREQRDPNSETFCDWEPVVPVYHYTTGELLTQPPPVGEAILLQELRRLQAAVMGEDQAR